MDTAIELVMQSSYANVGVAEICKSAGVTKGGFYHYFETKADLFYEASKFYWETKQDRLNAIFSASKTGLEQLDSVIEYIIEKQNETAGLNPDNPVTGCPLFTAAAQVGTGEEKVRLAALEIMERLQNYNAALVRTLQAEGVVDIEADAVQCGRLMHQYIHGLMQYGRIQRDLDAIKRDLRAGLYNALGVKKEFRVVGAEQQELAAPAPKKAANG